MGERITNGDFSDGINGWAHYPDGYGSCNMCLVDDYGAGPCLYMGQWYGCADAWASQSVDLTNVPTLDVVMAPYAMDTSAPIGWVRIYVDSDIIFETTNDDASEFESHSIPISYTGTHTVKFACGNSYDGVANTIKSVSAIGSDIPPAPVADFSGTPTSGETPLSIVFTDLSTGAPTEWLWNFGDGFLSAVQNPTHVYETAGVYTVVLKATNAGGFDVKTRTNYIAVTRGPNRIHPLWTKQIGPL